MADKKKSGGAAARRGAKKKAASASAVAPEPATRKKSATKRVAGSRKGAGRKVSGSVETPELDVRSMSGKSLVIVESPAKAKTIGKYLGPDYRVRATIGHVRDLPEKGLGIDIERGFQPTYVPVPGKEKTLAELKSAAR